MALDILTKEKKSLGTEQATNTAVRFVGSVLSLEKRKVEELKRQLENLLQEPAVKTSFGICNNNYNGCDAKDVLKQ